VFLPSGCTRRLNDLANGSARRSPIKHTHTQDGAFYIHMFYYTVPHYRQYHGKRIDPDTRLSYKDSARRTETPDRDLLRWHYKQYVQARVRGYAYDMNLNRQGGEQLS
jgi:hypothetical protein